MYAIKMVIEYKDHGLEGFAGIHNNRYALVPNLDWGCEAIDNGEFTFPTRERAEAMMKIVTMDILSEAGSGWSVNRSWIVEVESLKMH